jgi:hypothetical protein
MKIGTKLVVGILATTLLSTPQAWAQKSSKAQKSLKTMRPTAVKATVVKAGKTAKAKSTKSPTPSAVTQPGPTPGAVATASPSGRTNTCVIAGMRVSRILTAASM